MSNVFHRTRQWVGPLLLGLASIAHAHNLPEASTVAATPSANGAPAVQSVNIQDVQPEASANAGYLQQNNGERARVQPGNNAPMWRQVGQGVAGYSSLPVTQAPEAGVLVQPMAHYPGARFTNAGEAWRQVRNQWILPYGGSLILIALLACGILFMTKGRMGQDHASAGSRMIERFTPFERAAHWTNAAAFCTLALSGVVMAFGKFFVLPVLGTALTGWLSYALKTLHNFVGPLFAVSLLIVILTFVKDNIANAADFNWLSKAGGMFSKEQVPSHRFNAGEKGMFWWGVTVPGVVVVGSGLVLDQLIPGVGQLRSQMQVAHMIHAVCAIWMICLIIGHIYMGTAGVRGAHSGMKSGHVPEGWAREHHELWLNDINAGKIPAQRSAAANSSAKTPVSAVSA